MPFSQQTTLGRTSLKVGRLGISSSFGAPAAAYEEAFARGCNYFNWGTFIRGRSGAMRTAIGNLVAQGKRDNLAVAMLTYAHNAWLTEHFLVKGLKAAHRGAETETYPYLTGDDRPGVVSFTATDWRKLLGTKKLPPGERPLTAAECYRFVLSHPAVDVCMMGAKTMDQMRENLAVLDQGPLSGEEMERVRMIGKLVYGK